MHQIDPIIHQPVRLQIMAALVSLDSDAEVDFLYLRARLKLTDGNLSSHLAKLEAAGYVKQNKVFEANKPRTYLRLSSKGRDAFTAHVAALRNILKQTSPPE